MSSVSPGRRGPRSSAARAMRVSSTERYALQETPAMRRSATTRSAGDRRASALGAELSIVFGARLSSFGRLYGKPLLKPSLMPKGYLSLPFSLDYRLPPSFPTERLGYARSRMIVHRASP